MKVGRRMTIEEINASKPKNSLLTAKYREDYYNSSNTFIWGCMCRCACGKLKLVQIRSIISGSARSCGCLKKNTDRKRKYSQTIKSLNGQWHIMIRRCYDKKANGYKNYGGNGVRVCNQWLKSYESFLKWSLSNGWKEGLQIDKDIKGSGKLYSPSNCLWVTPSQNGRHKINSVHYMYEGKKTPLIEICEMRNKKYKTILARRWKHPDKTIEELLLNTKYFRKSNT